MPDGTLNREQIASLLATCDTAEDAVAKFRRVARVTDDELRTRRRGFLAATNRWDEVDRGFWDDWKLVHPTDSGVVQLAAVRRRPHEQVGFPSAPAGRSGGVTDE